MIQVKGAKPWNDTAYMLSDYLFLKGVHVTCVVLTYCGFFVRGVWMLRGSELLQARWVRILPHLVDTALLASAIALAWTLRQYPFVQPWLTAKVTGLVLYIVLGTVALRRGRTRAIRLGAWLAAQAVFFYVVAVALTRSPVPWAG